MFLSDSDCLVTNDLAMVDAEVISLPQNQGIILPPLEGPDSIIRKAAEDTCREIQSIFQNFSGYMTAPGLNAAHIAAVLNINSTAVSRPRQRIQQVVGVNPDPTKHQVKDYIRYRALYNFFRALFHHFVGNGNKGDRYEVKMNFYKEEARLAWQRLEAVGLPIVLIPLACPGSIRDVNNGTWDDSNVTAGGSGSTETGNDYDVAITYVGANYQSWSVRQNSESAPSAKQTIQATAGQVVSVSISTLVPPNGQQQSILGLSDGVYTPMAATGWNVYVGLTGSTLYLQNSTPIPIGTTSYTLADAPTLKNGMPVGVGQAEDMNFAAFRITRRG